MSFPLTLAAFVVRRPEFGATSTTLVQANLDEAARSIDATVWGDLAEDGHMYLAAQGLAITPEGMQAGLGKLTDSGKLITVYDKRLEDLQYRVGTAYRVVLE
jgi:hypothetical protein